MAEQISREEAIQILTRERDNMDELLNYSGGSPGEVIEILKLAGAAVGYAPTFRCLVMGLAPEDSVRWGK